MIGSETAKSEIKQNRGGGELTTCHKCGVEVSTTAQPFGSPGGYVGCDRGGVRVILCQGHALTTILGPCVKRIDGSPDAEPGTS